MTSSSFRVSCVLSSQLRLPSYTAALETEDKATVVPNEPAGAPKGDNVSLLLKSYC